MSYSDKQIMRNEYCPGNKMIILWRNYNVIIYQIKVTNYVISLRHTNVILSTLKITKITVILILINDQLISNLITNWLPNNDIVLT